MPCWKGPHVRIGIDARNLYLSRPKGLGRYLKGLLTALLGIAPEHSYVLFYDADQAINIPLWHHDSIINAPLRAKSEELWEQWHLPCAALKFDIDVFHSPANTTMAWSSCPVIMTLHDTLSHDAARNWGMRLNLYWNYLQPQAYNRVFGFITATEYSKNKLSDRFRLEKDKIQVIAHGIEDDFRVPVPNAVEAQRARFDLNKPYFFMLGGTTARKNIKTLLQAFERFCLSESQTSLVISGVKNQKGLQDQIRALSCAGRVRLLDYVTEEELIALYNGAQAFVFPSLDEGFGLPPLEAMACGAPVVASDASCIPEVVGDAAFLADCRTPDSLADALLYLYHNETLRRELREKGLQHVKKFRWEDAARKTLEVYERAAGMKSIREVEYQIIR